MSTKINADDLTPPFCAKMFNDIADRLESGDKRFGKNEETLNEHEIDIAVLKTCTESVTKSLSGLAKALWGIVITVATAGIGFVIWYIQTL